MKKIKSSVKFVLDMTKTQAILTRRFKFSDIKNDSAIIIFHLCITRRIILKIKNMKKLSVKFEKSIFAGGCFWGMSDAFKKIGGVNEVVSGYIGGRGENPNYEDYAKKGFVEGIKITYNPTIIGYDQLLDLFWKRIDPTDPDGQFRDRGSQYISAIFYRNEKQRQAAMKSKKSLEKSGIFEKPIATKIFKASKFYPAEQYHQDYHEKNPDKYKLYYFSCGIDQRLRDVWGHS